jgi:hypothetical protein
MVLTAILLMTIGLVVSLLGFKLFKVLLPIVGLVTGSMIGYTGFQGLYGTGTVSTTVAVFVALAVGMLLAILSFVFFEIAVIVISGIIVASLFSFLSISLGLGANGFVVFLLSLAGFIIGINVAVSRPLSASFVMTITSMAGVSFILASIFLIAGDVSLTQLQNDGVIRSVLRVVDQSFLWLFVWLAGTIVARSSQMAVATSSVLKDEYQFKTGKK